MEKNQQGADVKQAYEPNQARTNAIEKNNGSLKASGAILDKTPKIDAALPATQYTYKFANISTQHAKGGGNASIVMEEFVSFGCGVCAKGRNLTDRALKRQNNTLALKYRHFPLPQTPNAYLAAQAFECAADQDKEWEIEGWLFANPGKYDSASLVEMANMSGMDAGMFSFCLSSGAKRRIVDDDLAEVRARGIKGTPYFVIGNGTIPSLLDDEDFFAEVFRLSARAE